ncbi:MAG: CRISPR-associated RAMP protein Csx7 [Thermodesulfobacteriota bacterium]
MTYSLLEQKVRITGQLTFETAFHIGSGKEGELATDMGVMKDHLDRPVLPGSTLKGCFRATAERLAEYLGASACLLDTELSEVNCVTDQKYFSRKKTEFQELEDERAKLNWIDEHVCRVCRLFGSPVQSSRIFFSDGILQPGNNSFLVRDGVSLDRDSGTARHGIKYDFEVAAADAVFDIVIDLENPDDTDLALVAAVLAEWDNGFRIGGFTSRGLGRVRLHDTQVMKVDLRDADQRTAYLLKREMTPADDLLTDAIGLALNA